MSNSWVCYLLMSLDSNCTYIGSSNNQPKRLQTHNIGKGAKRTRGQNWIPIIVISGFHHKNTCLSFEAGWKRLAERRNNDRLFFINQMTNSNFKYTSDTKWNRLMDLIYFVHNFTLLDTKFKINYDITCPIYQPDDLTITIFMEDFILDLPWPHFIKPIMKNNQ